MSFTYYRVRKRPRRRFIMIFSEGLKPGTKAFKALILFTLTLSTSLTVMLLRISRTSSGYKLYLASTVVFLTECLKLLFIQSTSVYQNGLPKAIRIFKEDILGHPRETLKLVIPAGLYVIQNNLLYVALTNLDTATYQITYQLKILSTAVFSVLLLSKRLKAVQWAALVLLSAGVTLVQLHSANAEEQRDVLYNSEYFIGVTCVLLACVTSGLSGVYFEMLVKRSVQKSILVRNTQLGLVSLPMTLIAVAMEDFSDNDFFQGYDNLVLMLILFQSLGGLLVAIVVKYADNILKGFSTSVSIILCTICSYLFIEEDPKLPGFMFYLGAFAVISATFIYSAASSSDIQMSPAQKAPAKAKSKSYNT